jgi:hypothetical protein
MRSVGLVSGVLAAALFACGGGGGGGDTCNPGPSFTLTITATTVTPQNACVQPGGTVIFQNNDSASRHVEFDQSGCPTGPDISPGQAGNVVMPGTAIQCTYHVSLASGTTFTGTVVAANVAQSGGGY